MDGGLLDTATILMCFRVHSTLAANLSCLSDDSRLSHQGLIRI